MESKSRFFSLDLRCSLKEAEHKLLKTALTLNYIASEQIIITIMKIKIKFLQLQELISTTGGGGGGGGGNLIGHYDFWVFCLFMPLATSWWCQFGLNRQL